MQIPTILVVAGIVFLLLSLVNIKGIITPKTNRKPLRVTGGILLITGILLSVLPDLPPVMATPTIVPPADTVPAPDEPKLAPAPCSPEVNITFPRMDEKLDGDGTVDIKGTASSPDFQFYKVEYGAGEVPSQFHSISSEHYTPVIKGRLDTWNTGALSEGVYKLLLTVVKKDGQSLWPPCEVRVFIER